MIAKKAGVSAAAVSMALRKQPGVSPALALKIQEIARSLNYQPPALLQEAMGRLRMQQPARFHSQVAFCTDADYRTDNFDSLTRRARNLGYGLDIFRLHQMTRKELRSALLHRNVRGILLNINSWAFADLEFLWEEFACVSLGYSRYSSRSSSAGTLHRSHFPKSRILAHANMRYPKSHIGVGSIRKSKATSRNPGSSTTS
jgi:DNA-binding LacI/PurR family transcriptional regulator